MQKPITIIINGGIRSGAAQISERALAVAALFGVSIERGAERKLFDDVQLHIRPGDVILITGPSGAGKSTLLRRIGAELGRIGEKNAVKVMALDDVRLPADQSVIDCFPGAIDIAAAHLARAGLSEAHVFLRAPAELSEGQRFRYRLAQFFASDADVLVADEFCATLDRVTARVVAFQLGKFVRASMQTNRPRAVIVATTHEDLAGDLRATVRIWKGLGSDVTVETS